MSCSIEESQSAGSVGVENKSNQQQSVVSNGTQSITLASTSGVGVVGGVKPLGTPIMLGGMDHYSSTVVGQHQHHHHHHHHHMQTAQQQQQQQTLITLQPPANQPLQIIQPNVLNNGAGTQGSNTTYATLSNANVTVGGSVGGVPAKMHMNPSTVSSTTTTATAAKLTGNHFVITTLGPNGSQKVVTLQAATPSTTNNNNANTALTVINGNNNTNTTTTTSSTPPPSTNTANSNNQSNTDSSSSGNNNNNNPTTTTITLTSPPPNSSTTNSNSSPSTNSSASSSAQPASILFPLQTSQQYTSFIDAGNQLSSTTSSGNLFSPLGSSTNSYYTFQPATTILTTQTAPNTTSTSGAASTNTTSNQATNQQQQSPNRMSIDQQQQQQQEQNQNQQPQQTLYVMYDSAPNASDLDNGQMDFEGHVSHTAQAAPITVQWLIDNFEPAEGCSLRRSTLYNYYLLHCTEQRIEPVNPASFGKLIRSVFLGLRTRRLGTRGNSKYHYYGIRVKMNSPLNQIAEDNMMAMRNHPYSMSPTGSPSPSSQSNGASSSQQQTPPSSQPASKRVKTSSGGAGSSSSNGQVYESASTTTIDYKPSSLLTTVNSQPQTIVAQIVDPNSQQQQQANLTTVVLTNGAANINQIGGKQQLLVNPNTITKIVKTNGKSNGNEQQIHPQQQQQQHVQNDQQQQQFKPTNDQQMEVSTSSNQTNVPTTASATSEQDDVNQIKMTIQLPEYGSIQLTDSTQLPANCTLDDVKKFEELYKQHCEKILDLFVALKLNSIQSLWSRFWRSNSATAEVDANVSADSIAYYEAELSSEKFFALCECPAVCEFVINCDFLFYQFCIEILIPDVFNCLPHSLVTSIRNLSKSVESWLAKALSNVSEQLRTAKLAVIRAFSMALKRYTSLSHLIQTVKNTMQNEGLFTHMFTDINKVDFSYIREQLRWTCDWENIDETVNRFENDFKEALRNHEPKTMESWLAWIDQMVTSYMQQHENTTQSYSKMAKNFILTWSLLCDTTVRDLTLRSAPTFGSFHLVRLLYGEYISYLIERKIAEYYKKPPLQIMCPPLF